MCGRPPIPLTRTVAAARQQLHLRGLGHRAKLCADPSVEGFAFGRWGERRHARIEGRRLRRRGEAVRPEVSVVIVESRFKVGLKSVSVTFESSFKVL